MAVVEGALDVDEAVELDEDDDEEVLGVVSTLAVVVGAVVGVVLGVVGTGLTSP